MKIVLPIVCFMAFIHIASARADSRNTGNELIRDCHSAVRVLSGDSSRSPALLFEASRCINYVGGLMDGLVIGQGLGHSHIFCPPIPVSYGQDARIVAKWLDEHPDQLNEHQSVLTFKAFADAWPCKPKK